MNHLAMNIKQYRKALNLSQVELAKAIDVSQTSVAHYEKAKRKPTIDVMLHMAKLFNISLDDLVGDESRITEVTHTQNIDFDAVKQSLLLSLMDKNYNTFYMTMSTLANKVSMEEMIKNVVTDLQVEMGIQWEKGCITVADEHYATHTIRRTMSALYPVEPSNLLKKRAIALTVGTEEHTLGLELISSFLNTQGIETWFLGSQVPLMSLNKMIKDYKPDYLILSITLSEQVNSLMIMLESIITTTELNIVIGGQGSRHVDLTHLNNPHVLMINDVKELVTRLNAQ